MKELLTTSLKPLYLIIGQKKKVKCIPPSSFVLKTIKFAAYSFFIDKHFTRDNWLIICSMKGLGLTLVIGSMILVCRFEFSTAAPPAPADVDDALLVYRDGYGDDHYLPLRNNDCVNLEEPSAVATYKAHGSIPAYLYPDRDCGGAATAIAPNQEYHGALLMPLMKSVKKRSTPSHKVIEK